MIGMSRYRLSSSNLLEMAIAVEESSKEFYIKLSEMFPNFRYHFDALAKDEERHERMFEQILKQKVKVLNMDDEYMTVLESIFTGLFGSLRYGASRAKESYNIELAIKEAIQIEKDSLLLYLSMNRIFDNIGEKKIDRIIKEEQYHLQRVQNLKP